MKTKIFTLSLAIIASISLWAQTFMYYGTCGDSLTWTLENNVLTISGTGEMTNYDYRNAPWDDLPISTAIIQSGVTSIGDYAFCNCENLTSVTIPNSVTSIGDYAFYNCSSLTPISIPNSVTRIGDYAFYLCLKLTSITIPNSATSIGDYAFAYCSSLTSSITIPNSVTSIGNGAFAYCGLTYIDVSINNPNYCSIDGVLFNKEIESLIQCPSGKQGAYSIPNSVTSIGDYAFGCCRSLTSISIPNSVTSIGEEAFVFCSGLTSIYNYRRTPCNVSDYVFWEVDKFACTLYVPTGSEEMYRAANGWKDFFTIQGFDAQLAIKNISDNVSVSEILANPKTQIFTLQGNDVTSQRHNLTTGYYILRYGNQNEKVFIR